MKIFVTGATGYIGNKLALAAAEKGFTVVALVRSTTSPNVPVHPNISLFKGDITDPVSVKSAMARCHAVLHAAALTQLWDRDRTLFDRINVQGTAHVLEAALHHRVSRFVFTSSCAVLGPSHGTPVTEDTPRVTPFENDYEISKAKAEALVKEASTKGLHAMIVSPPRVYGPGLQTKGNPINKLVQNTLSRGIGFMPAASKAVGNYAFVDDVVNGHLLALQKGRSGERYILGGENVSYERLFKTIALLSGKRIPIVPVPTMVLKAWAGVVSVLCQLAGLQTHLSPAVVDRLMQDRALCCEKAVRELGYTITPFDVGISRTIEALKKR